VLNGEIGIAGSVEQAVLRYASLAKEAGLHGVVASPLEVDCIKAACGGSFVTVTPGIRPAGADIGDQARVMTPKAAFGQGTDYVVIGRPITASADPRQTLESIIDSIVM
jgi:orotidine-5'-phosphate decarboxylase